MLKVEISNHPQENDMDLIKIFHEVAAVNGSINKIDLEYRGDKIILCNSTYAARSYTKGYFALLYLIDICHSAYTAPSEDGNWFYVVVRNEYNLINYLKGQSQLP